MSSEKLMAVESKPSTLVGFLKSPISRILIILITLAADQYTKHLARLHLGLPNGDPDYFKFKQIFGEWLQFRLVYNTGAAFGMKPQSLIPFLNPTLFYLLFSSVAISILVLYYRKLGVSELWQKLGVALILSGAFGNLIDRVRFQKVTDFIEVGIPGVQPHWPNFNIADSCVCVGVGIILFAPLLTKFFTPELQPNSSAPLSADDNGASRAGS